MYSVGNTTEQLTSVMAAATTREQQYASSLQSTHRLTHQVVIGYMTCTLYILCIVQCTKHPLCCRPMSTILIHNSSHGGSKINRSMIYLIKFYPTCNDSNEVVIIVSVWKDQRVNSEYTAHQMWHKAWVTKDHVHPSLGKCSYYRKSSQTLFFTYYGR